VKLPRNIRVPILNRDFKHPADGWYQIEPKGLHPNRRAGVVQVIDEEAAVSIVNLFNESAKDPDFAGMLIDHEHFKHQEDQETRAFGWLMELTNRTDGIYAKIRWTTTGQAAVDGGDYRFFSTEYDPQTMAILNKDANGTYNVRPLALAGLTITNDPNNKGGKPITNRLDQSDQPDDGQAVTITEPMKNLIAKLGLPADAQEAAALTAVETITNRATTAETESAALKVTIAELLTKLDGFEAAAKKFSEEQADRDLEPIKNRLTPEHYATLRGLLIANRAATLPIVEMIPKTDVPAAKATTVRPDPLITNRASVPTTDPLNQTKETFDVLVNRAMADKKLTKSAAIDAIMATNPEEYIIWRNTGGLL
jgi:phage I-like protein